MSTITRFEDLDVWKKARELNRQIHPVVKAIQSQKGYDLAKQMSRSAGSCMDNIAEGFEREGNREFIQMLAIAKGSIGETRSQLYRALDCDFVNEIDFKDLYESCEELSKNISGFMKYLRNSDIKGNKFRK